MRMLKRARLAKGGELIRPGLITTEHEHEC